MSQEIRRKIEELKNCLCEERKECKCIGQAIKFLIRHCKRISLLIWIEKENLQKSKKNGAEPIAIENLKNFIALKSEQLKEFRDTLKELKANKKTQTQNVKWMVSEKKTLMGELRETVRIERASKKAKSTKPRTWRAPKKIVASPAPAPEIVYTLDDFADDFIGGILGDVVQELKNEQKEVDDFADDFIGGILGDVVQELKNEKCEPIAEPEPENFPITPEIPKAIQEIPEDFTYPEENNTEKIYDAAVCGNIVKIV